MEGKRTQMRAVVREWGKLVFKSSYDIPSCGNKDVLVRVKLFMAVPKVVADLMTKDWSGSGTTIITQSDHATQVTAIPRSLQSSSASNCLI